MPLNMKLEDCVCACCGHRQKVETGKYKMSEYEFLDLQEYYDFKFVGVNVCASCGYASEKISDPASAKVKKLVASANYQDVLNCKYLDNFKDLPFDEYEQFKNGDADALALVWEEEGKTGIEYAKLQSWIYELKSSMRNICYENVADIGDKNFADKYWDLIHILSEQMHASLQKCLMAVSGTNISNPYEAIFVAENLTRAGDYDSARKLVGNLNSSFEVDEELQKYIEEFLTKVEKI